MDRRNRAGPYRVVRRFRGAVGRYIGRVYEAYNEDTGAPAVVVTPGRSRAWWPRGDWTLTLSSSASPPRLALEATDGLREEDLDNLPEELTRLVAGAADVARRPEGVAHLVGAPGRARRCRAAVRSGRAVRAALAAVALCALAVVAGVLASAVGEHRRVDVVVSAPTAEPTGFTYTAGQLPMAPMPAEPFARQKRPPCNPRLEDELVGGCWTRLKVKGTATCPAEAYERAGECYLPALAEPKPGQSWGP